MREGHFNDVLAEVFFFIFVSPGPQRRAEAVHCISLIYPFERRKYGKTRDRLIGLLTRKHKLIGTKFPDIKLVKKHDYFINKRNTKLAMNSFNAAFRYSPNFSFEIKLLPTRLRRHVLAHPSQYYKSKSYTRNTFPSTHLCIKRDDILVGNEWATFDRGRSATRVRTLSSLPRQRAGLLPSHSLRTAA
jgi:hypothetical protein